MNIVLLGAPGSGKGTQAKRLMGHYGVPHISTGDIFREEMSKKSDVGIQVESYVKSGRLVPDELTIEIVTRRVQQPDAQKGFILDGFPRTVGQAEALDSFLNGAKRPLDKVAYLELSEAGAVGRLSTRRQCDKCGKIYNLATQPPKAADKCDVDGGKIFQREDDKPDTIRKRLSVFNDLTQPLISYYRGAGILDTINGDQDVELVFKQMTGLLDELAK